MGESMDWHCGGSQWFIFKVYGSISMEGYVMADIDGIKKRIRKLEGRDKHPPRIVWKGQEDNVDLKPGQKMLIIGWMEPSDHEQ